MRSSLSPRLRSRFLLKRLFWFLCLSSVTVCVGGLRLAIRPALAEANPSDSEAAACPDIPDAQTYDAIVFGDEVPGVMSALQLKRELQARGHSSQVAIVTEGDITRGIGGHLVRGGLAYLDRNQVPPELRSEYGGNFGRPSRLYQELLELGQVDTIAIDRTILSQNFKQALEREGIDVIGNVELGTVQTTDTSVCAFTAGDRTYQAKQFIDASQSGELAAASGVEMMQGLEALGLPQSTLSIGLVFELYGVPIENLKAAEAATIERLFDPNDAEAQGWLDVASGGNPAKRRDLLYTLQNADRTPKLLYQGTPDSADVRALAISIAVHGHLGREYDLKSSGFLFDRANIAVFPDRLSFNALLFYADAETARRLSESGAKPTPEMQAVANEIKALFASFGIPRIEVMEELYIRNAGQIANSLDELPATLMAAGGVPEVEALGTFSYHLDDRGGIDGLDEQIQSSILRLMNFRQMPTFNYGFRHTLPQERENLAVLGPASGFGGLGTTAGRIVEFNVSVGEGLAIAVATALSQNRSLHTITNLEVREALGYEPDVYGYPTGGFQAVYRLERQLRGVDYERNYLESARAFLDGGNYTEAVRELSKAIRLEPDGAQAYYLRGNSLLNLEAIDPAIADYTEAVRLNPELLEAYLHRGFLQIFKGQYNQAIADFDRVLELDANRGDALFGAELARALQSSALTGGNWYAEALPVLDAAIERQPELAVAHMLRGVIQVELGNPEAARGDFQQALDLHEAQGNPFGANNARRAIDALRE